jgi:hypothetical protein
MKRSTMLMLLFLLFNSGCGKREGGVETIKMAGEEHSRVLLRISIDSDGKVFLQGKEKSLTELECYLRENVIKYGTDIVIEFSAPPELPYKKLEPVILKTSFSALGLFEYMFVLPGEKSLRCSSDYVVSCGPPGMIDVIVHIPSDPAGEECRKKRCLSYKLTFRDDYGRAGSGEIKGLESHRVTDVELRKLALLETYKGRPYIIKLAPEPNTSFGEFYHTIKLTNPNSNSWPSLNVMAKR